MEDTKKYLIILDLNGVLCYKEDRNTIDLAKSVGPEWVETKSYLCRLRPNCREFIEYILDHKNLRLGIWSSTTYPNSQPIIDSILTKEQQKNLEFVWYRDRVKLDPEIELKYQDHTIKTFDTVKILNDVFLHPTFERKWNETNTLIVDDSSRKMRFNSAQTVYIISQFTSENIDIDVFEELKLAINLKFFI